MTHDTSVDKIEDQLNEDRAALSDAMERLYDRFSPDWLTQDAQDQLRSNIGALGGSIERTVRKHPVATAVAGVGIAWLIFGRRGEKVVHPARLTRKVGSVESLVTDYGPQVAAALLASGIKAMDDVDWSHRIDSFRAKTSAKLADIEKAAAHHAENVAKGAVDQFNNVRDFAAERTAAVAEFARHTQESLSLGLDDLPEPAREKIILAREKAYRAAQSGSAAVKKGAEKTGAFAKENPLLAGLIVAAVGVAVAAALPRRKDDVEEAEENLKSGADDLMDEAAELMKQERAQVKSSKKAKPAG
ncbi:hypothetical protein [Pseudorhodobacter sp.]|uniref:hypothetical protein n=1 Tax=Pseudorhodobacter sp. TaxID=1934400 RepID=UPI00264A4047|nr:hypothetical protein [Pseudorhodobacter sp.]MDN5787508.1 hypothetical protein [Pseudorhodobacter sp.]